MAFINSIQEPLDMNHGNFDIIGINRKKEKKDPIKTIHIYLHLFLKQQEDRLYLAN